ncbi:hypothetical protein N6A90_001273 [Acinetobacter baumannii]|nr:hypothetical protein [Acinetobacter baumannii]EKU4658200.1 hypothetical protein [Acinetobacter baumannii]EKV5599015.1 hypothetical protein [Acinetobacter baumannii]EKV5699894.1 hypothetical protein [Acinetobacter baumannii]EKV6803143.1 hypothetical protein [Acinetobacter baumannii]
MTSKNHGVATRPTNNNIHPFPAFIGPVHPQVVFQNVLDYSVQERMYQVCLQRLLSPDFADQTVTLVPEFQQNEEFQGGVKLYMHPGVIAFLLLLFLTSVYLLVGV